MYTLSRYAAMGLALIVTELMCMGFSGLCFSVTGCFSSSSSVSMPSMTLWQEKQTPLDQTRQISIVLLFNPFHILSIGMRVPIEKVTLDAAI